MPKAETGHGAQVYLSPVLRDCGAQFLRLLPLPLHCSTWQANLQPNSSAIATTSKRAESQKPKGKVTNAFATRLAGCRGEGGKREREREGGRGQGVVPSGLFPRGASGVCLVTLCLKRATVIKRNISIVAAKLKRNKRQQGVARRKQEVPLVLSQL